MEAKPSYSATRGRPRKKAKYGDAELLSRKDLEMKLQLLEKHNNKLTQLLSLTSQQQETQCEAKPTLNVGACDSRRHILLKAAYLGWDYQNFSSQQKMKNMVEKTLLQTLRKLNLIESTETSLHRCGDTKEGFCPFDQVFSAMVRSHLPTSIASTDAAGQRIKAELADCHIVTEKDSDETINYTKMINDSLPPEIQVVAWCPVMAENGEDFKNPIRTYKYFFPKGNLNIESMNEAMKHLVGEHDFRNFGTHKGTTDRPAYRVVLNAEISPLCCDTKEKDRTETFSMTFNDLKDLEKLEGIGDDFGGFSDRRKTMDDVNEDVDDGYRMHVATIEGRGFMGNDILKIMGLIFNIGEGKSTHRSLEELLDTDANLRPPSQYLASELPLRLHRTTFKSKSWQWDKMALHNIISQLQMFWSQHSVRAAALRDTLTEFEKCLSEIKENEGIAGFVSEDLPHNQCQNLTSQGTVTVTAGNPVLSTSDHEYSSSRTQDMNVEEIEEVIEEESEFTPEATLLLIKLIEQRIQRFLVLESRPTVLREVQNEFCSFGYSFSVEKISCEWKLLLTTYRRLKERSDKGLCENIVWDYYELLDDLLSTSCVDIPKIMDALHPKPKSEIQVVCSPEMEIVTKADSLLESPEKTIIVNNELPDSETGASQRGQTHPSAPDVKQLPYLPYTCDIDPMALLGYQLKCGRTNVDIMDEFINLTQKRLDRKFVYRRKKEELEENSLVSLKGIEKATKSLKNELLSLQ